MMITKRFIIVLTILLATIFSCQKKLLKRVTVTGQLLNVNGRLPLVDVRVTLYADNASRLRPTGANSVRLADTNTDEDGYFKLTSAASKRNYYYLHVGDREVTVLIDGSDQFTISGKTKDLGVVLVNY